VPEQEEELTANGQQGSALREDLGSFGVWLGALGQEPAAREREIARRLEGRGFGALWYGEALANREAFSHAAILLGATETIAVASGIANIWVRDATAASNGANALNEASTGASCSASGSATARSSTRVATTTRGRWRR
jgi:hypothetical protein